MNATATKTTSKTTTDESKKKRVRHSYLYAVGRRKTAIARTRLFKNGTGKITVNEKDYTEYFPVEGMQKKVEKPLDVTGTRKTVDISVKVAGGGPNGQVEAVQHGIARALLVLEKEHRATLKPEGMLKRDPRMKERKKPGLKRARRAPQWAKR